MSLHKAVYMYIRGLNFWKEMLNNRPMVEVLLILIGERNGNPHQYSCLENPMDRGAWRATVLEVAKSRTQLKQLSRIIVQTCR